MRNLPEGIAETDFICSYEDRYSEPYDNRRYTQWGGSVEFEIWYTERFGWCIPTLGISGISSRARSAGITTSRTYGIATKDGGLVSMGMGPHVLETHTVYVKKDRFDALKFYLELRLEGQIKAGDRRDQISTQMARTTARRTVLFGGAWDR